MKGSKLIQLKNTVLSGLVCLGNARHAFLRWHQPQKNFNDALGCFAIPQRRDPASFTLAGEDVMRGVRICQSRTFRGPARGEIQDGWVVDETLKLLVVAVVPPRNVIQTIKVMATILRARIRRAMGGFNPLAIKAAQNSLKVSSAANGSIAA